MVASPIVLFLGAGASSSFDKPLMGQFISELKRDPGLASITEGFPYPVTGKVLLDNITKEVGEDLEEVLDELEIISRIKHLSSIKLTELRLPPAVGKTNTVSALQESVIKVTKSLSDLIRKNIVERYSSIDSNKVAKLYSDVFGTLSFDGDRFITIFTTNYDPAIEVFCEQTEYELVNGFKAKGRSQDYIWDRATYDEFSPDSNSKKVVLFKLHGSVNWYKKGQDIVHSAIPFYLFEQAKRNIIIWPTKTKVAIEDPFFTSYDYLHHCLQHTKAVIFIGYSFRDFDTLTRIKSALIINPELRLTIVDPQANALYDRYFKPLKEKSETAVVTGSFGYSDISTALKAASSL